MRAIASTAAAKSVLPMYFTPVVSSIVTSLASVSVTTHAYDIAGRTDAVSSVGPVELSSAVTEPATTPVPPSVLPGVATEQSTTKNDVAVTVTQQGAVVESYIHWRLLLLRPR